MKKTRSLSFLQLCCCILTLCSPALAQDSCAPVTYQSIINKIGFLLLSSGITAGAEGYTIAGKTGIPAGNYYASLTSIDNKGAVRWSRQLGLDSSAYTKIIPADGGHYIALGTCGSPFYKTKGWLLTRFDSSGNIDWCRRYYQPGNNSGDITDAIVTTGGGIAFCSDSLGFSGVVASTDAGGNLLWAKSIGSLMPYGPLAGLVQVGDTLLVAANGQFSTTATNLFKLSATDGRLLATTQLGTSNILQMVLVRSMSKKGDRYYINSFSPNPSVSRSDPTIFCYDVSGRLLSLRKYYIPEVLLTNSSTLLLTAGGEWGGFALTSGSSLYAFRLPQVGNTATGILYPSNSSAVVMIATGDNGFLCLGTAGSGLQFIRLIKTDSSGRTPGCTTIPVTLTAEDVSIRITSVSFPPPAGQVYQTEVLTNSFAGMAVTKTPLCALNSCTSLHITGFDSICMLRVPVPYKAKKDINCFSAVQWYTNNPSALLQDVTDSTVNVMFTQQGTAMLYARMVSGCSVLTDSIKISVNVSPALDLGPDIQLCKAGAVQLSARPGFKWYRWQDGSTDSLFVAPGVGQYSVTAENFCGYILHDTMNIIHGGDLPFDMGPDQQKCNNDSLLLTAPPGFSRYDWLPAYNMRLPLSNQAQVWPGRDTAYLVKAYTSTGCMLSDTVLITVFHSPAIDLGKDTSLCKGQTLSLQAPPGFAWYRWQDGAASTTYTASRKGMYILQASDGRCVSKDTLVVKRVYPLPVVALGDDLVICKDQPKVFDAGSGFTSYTWQDGSASSTYSAAQPGVYWVRVTDSNHCSGADTAVVTGMQYCKKGIYFPNAFTPGSGSNASWRPLVIDGTLGGYRLQIFNRFGQKLFESTNPQNGWDGSWQGKPQPTGSFAWFCSYRFAGQEQKVEKGTFLLLR